MMMMMMMMTYDGFSTERCYSISIPCMHNLTDHIHSHCKLKNHMTNGKTYRLIVKKRMISDLLMLRMISLYLFTNEY
jgi:hypothetical protein